jgi:hypothetical protein
VQVPLEVTTEQGSNSDSTLQKTTTSKTAGEGAKDPQSERRVALIHRVIVQDKDYPKEYAILVTDRRLVFIRQKKTRSDFVLNYEMKIGTALVTDVVPKTLEDYEQVNSESLASDSANIIVPLFVITSLEMKADELKRRKRDFFLRLVMKMQKEIFQLYNFEIAYLDLENVEKKMKVYAVPLGAYFKPRRMVQNRERMLREYASDLLEIFRKVLPDEKISSGSPIPTPTSFAFYD